MIARRQHFDVRPRESTSVGAGHYVPILIAPSIAGGQTKWEKVMQEMQRPDGSMLSEIFTGEQVANGAAERRRKLLESFGMTLKKLEPVSKYAPHQGSRELERRVKQMLKAAQKASESA